MPDAAQAWAVLRNAELICSAEQVQAAIRRIAGEVTAVAGDAYPLVLAVMGGGVFFAGHLLPLLRFPLDFDYIHVTRYGQAIAGGAVDWRVAPPEAVQGRTVIVLDDILDGGRTMQAIRERIMAQGASALYCAVLVEKMLGVAKPARADFVGLQIPDRFVFGCGMDARGYWRNLPEIYALKDS